MTRYVVKGNGTCFIKSYELGGVAEQSDVFEWTGHRDRAMAWRDREHAVRVAERASLSVGFGKCWTYAGLKGDPIGPCWVLEL